MKYLFYVTLLSAILFAGSTDDFLFRNHTYNSTTLPYRLYIPEASAQHAIPIILTLHGAGERGNDNVKQITLNSIASVWARDTTEAKYPCYIVSPQCPSGKVWTNYTDFLFSLMDSLKMELNIDTNRIYVTGLSMGGYGTWSLIQSNPDYFTAALILCGQGNPSKIESRESFPPVWNFHGKEDKTVLPDNSRLCMKAIIARGEEVIYTECNDSVCEKMSNSKIDSLIDAGNNYFYTEYEGLGHSIWNQTYNNSLVQKWLFSKSKSEEVTDIKLVEENTVNGFYLSQNYPNPFNPATTIKYSIPNLGGRSIVPVQLKVYNLLGQEVATLVNEQQPAGNYEVKFDASNIASGIYLYKLNSGDFSSVKKLILLK